MPPPLKEKLQTQWGAPGAPMMCSLLPHRRTGQLLPGPLQLLLLRMSLRKPLLGLQLLLLLLLLLPHARLLPLRMHSLLLLRPLMRGAQRAGAPVAVAAAAAAGVAGAVSIITTWDRIETGAAAVERPSDCWVVRFLLSGCSKRHPPRSLLLLLLLLLLSLLLLLLWPANGKGPP